MWFRNYRCGEFVKEFFVNCKVFPHLNTCRQKLECYCNSVKIITLQQGYLKDSNAAAHSVNSDIFYIVINLSARSKSHIITFIS